MDRMLGYEIDLKADSGLSETSTFPLTGDFQVSAAMPHANSPEIVVRRKKSQTLVAGECRKGWLHHGGHNTIVPGEIPRFIRHIRSKDATMPGRHQIGVVDRLQRVRK